MTTKDKTREKLLSSMRKTKAVIGDQPNAKQAHATTYAPPASKPAKVAASPAKPAEATKSSSTRPSLASDPYQSRKRVWPD
jgi:hypothetical protein